jgi:signal transduction histidine kinase
MVNNLISNALKYSGDSKPVELNLSRDDTRMILRFKDEGIGIPQDDMNHLFEPFHRAANVGTISGTGLGLNIVKKIVEMHAGTIVPQSTVGVGTTFTVQLPLV